MTKAKPRSWWRMRQIRHRDAVALAVLSAAFLLAGELVNQDIPSVYEKYILQSGALNNLGFLILIVALIILGFTTYFGGVFVLLGGLHFSWGRVGRGSFLVGLGIGVSLTRLFRRVDCLLSDEVPDRRESELGGESFLRDDVALVELADLDLELAFAERLANQVRVRGGDEGLFSLMVYLHADGHRPGRGYNRSTSLYLFFAGL